MTDPSLLPNTIVKENIAALLRFLRDTDGFREVGIFSQPELEGFQVAPVACCAAVP